MSALQEEGLDSGKGGSAKNGPEVPRYQLSRGNRPLPTGLSFDADSKLQSRHSLLSFYSEETEAHEASKQQGDWASSCPQALLKLGQGG